jgi:hypothetical protein
VLPSTSRHPSARSTKLTRGGGTLIESNKSVFVLGDTTPRPRLPVTESSLNQTDLFPCCMNKLCCSLVLVSLVCRWLPRICFSLWRRPHQLCSLFLHHDFSNKPSPHTQLPSPISNFTPTSWLPTQASLFCQAPAQFPSTEYGVVNQSASFFPPFCPIVGWPKLLPLAGSSGRY